MAAHNPPLNPPPPLQIPARQLPPPGPPQPQPQPPQQVPPVVPPDGSLGSNIDLSWFKVVVMRCTAGLHEGAASVTLDYSQGLWAFLPNEFVESALQASSWLPIQHLVLKRHKLTDLPTNLASPSTLLPVSLTTLDLSFNNFVSLPPVVCDLVCLRQLYVNNNALCELPEDLWKLKDLEVLCLQYNSLTSLPVCICNIVSLKSLHLENNRVADIPSEISQLSSLRELYLSFNEIKFLPDSIQRLSSLEELYLTKNHLKRLPQGKVLEGLSSLKQLHLAENKLRFLPLSFINLRQLQGLTLSGNPLKFPPLSACRSGIAGLRRYIQEKYQDSTSEYRSPDGTVDIIITKNLYYDDSDLSESDTPHEETDKCLP